MGLYSDGWHAILQVWRAIINSSLVGITHTETLLPAALSRGPPDLG